MALGEYYSIAECLHDGSYVAYVAVLLHVLRMTYVAMYSYCESCLKDYIECNTVIVQERMAQEEHYRNPSSHDMAL
eukprot:1336749-Amphidinium_carterae.1